MPGKKILLLEPYYGGSHKQFIDGLAACLPARFTLLSLPARKWKMRMQLSAPWFAGLLRDREPKRRSFAAVLASTFTDLAVFKALVGNLPGWNNQCRYLSYFHENQFHYPGRLSKSTNHQFTAINFTTALVSDGIGFNSAFNRTTFLQHSRTYLQKATDTDMHRELAAIEQKSEVLYPGIDFDEIDACAATARKQSPPLIIWNHRWEHDKNPEAFFAALVALQQEGIDFRCAILGQRFRDIPRCFTAAREQLGDRCVHFDYLPDRSAYLQVLAQGDIVVSTALHEFFGLAVIEAVRAGCLPVLPARLAYPELFAAEYLYPEGGLYSHLKQLLLSGKTLSVEQGRDMTRRFSWPSLAGQYRAWLNISPDPLASGTKTHG